MHILLEAVAIFLGAAVVVYFLSQLGKGLESVMKNALNETVVPKLDEILRKLGALERKEG
jgi:hypothetical protein